MRSCILVSILLIQIPAPPALAQQENTRKQELTEKTYSAILKALQKLPVETHWKEVLWRPNFGVALEEARKQDKPILLWVMNGHPCGMT